MFENRPFRGVKRAALAERFRRDVPRSLKSADVTSGKRTPQRQKSKTAERKAGLSVRRDTYPLFNFVLLPLMLVLRALLIRTAEGNKKTFRDNFVFSFFFPRASFLSFIGSAFHSPEMRFYRSHGTRPQSRGISMHVVSTINKANNVADDRKCIPNFDFGTENRWQSGARIRLPRK